MSILGLVIIHHYSGNIKNCFFVDATESLKTYQGPRCPGEIDVLDRDHCKCLLLSFFVRSQEKKTTVHWFS